MGTTFRIVTYALDAVRAEEAAAAAWRRIEALDSILSDYDSTSELSRLVAFGAERPGELRTVGPDLFRVLFHGQQLARITEGAFDVTVGAYSRLWRRARRRGEVPAARDLSRAARRVGHDRLTLEPLERGVSMARPGVQLDLGGIAKGYAVDQALAVLASYGLEQALVDGGGDVAVRGAPPGRSGWRIALVGLDGERADVDVILTGGAVATSGDLERFVEIDGVRYSHLIDPRTGTPVTERSLVTVVVRGGSWPGMRADALATAVNVLGVLEGMGLIQRTPGAEARILYRAGRDTVVSQTPGFASALSSIQSFDALPEVP